MLSPSYPLDLSLFLNKLSLDINLYTAWILGVFAAPDPSESLVRVADVVCGADVPTLENAGILTSGR